MDMSTTNLLLLIILALLLCLCTLLFFFVRHQQQHGRLVIQGGGEGAAQRAGGEAHHEQLDRNEFGHSPNRVEDVSSISLCHPFLPGRNSHRLPMVCKEKTHKKNKAHQQKARLKQMSTSLARHANMGTSETIRASALQRADVPVDDPAPTYIPARQPRSVRPEARLRIRRDPVGASGGSLKRAATGGQCPDSADASSADQRAETDRPSNGDGRQTDGTPRPQPGLQDCD